jgi:hypothetical protein
MSGPTGQRGRYPALLTFQNSGIPFKTPLIDLAWAVGWKYSPNGK